MFHFNDCQNVSMDKYKKIIKKAFDKTLSITQNEAMNMKNDNLITKTQFKMGWLYLFGYKISKVIIIVILTSIKSKI
jgi:hypothetical protein